MARTGASRVSYHDLGPDTGDFRRDVIAGLSRVQKCLSPKYFYDARGSELFEAICELPEYYPTRTEIALMQDSAGEMARCLGPGCVLIEYGSGEGLKTRLLLRALRPAAYVPVDISPSALEGAARRLSREFPRLHIFAVVGDFSQPLRLPVFRQRSGRRRVVYFPGSTIGNLTIEEAQAFLAMSRAQVGPGGAMLIGVDLKKDANVLHAAYNDARGVTARFNLNVLARINRELGGRFDVAQFRHRATYHDDEGRVAQEAGRATGSGEREVAPGVDPGPGSGIEDDVPSVPRGVRAEELMPAATGGRSSKKGSSGRSRRRRRSGGGGREGTRR